MTFARWLKKQRLAAGLTQNQMADLLEMGRSPYLEIERGPGHKWGRGPTKIQEHGLRPLVAAIVAKKGKK